MTIKKTTRNSAKDKSFGLTTHIVKNVTTKVGKFFLSLIDKHFPPHHNQLFNGNNVKISYSCLPNIKSIVNAHNRKYCTCHQLLVEELATASMCCNIPYKKTVSAITFYTKQTLPQ